MTCPFGYSSSGPGSAVGAVPRRLAKRSPRACYVAPVTQGTANAKTTEPDSLSQWLTAKRCVILLYEDYIHLSPLQQVRVLHRLTCLQPLVFHTQQDHTNVVHAAKAVLSKYSLPWLASRDMCPDLRADLEQSCHRKASFGALLCSSLSWHRAVLPVAVRVHQR